MENKSNELLIRKSSKSKKPQFIRQDGHKKLRLGKKWRKPKGIQNKVRLGIRGYRRLVSVGFKAPASVRGLNKDGLEMIIVKNPAMVESLDATKQGIIISGTVGTKKKLQIIKIAKDKKIEILNIDGDAFTKKIEDEIKKKQEKKLKKEKKAKEKKAEEKKKEQKKKEEEKKEETKTIESIADEAIEDKKKKEKKEKDKILTQKNLKGV